jgi:hypothetical protein
MLLDDHHRRRAGVQDLLLQACQESADREVHPRERPKPFRWRDRARGPLFLIRWGGLWLWHGLMVERLRQLP